METVYLESKSSNTKKKPVIIEWGKWNNKPSKMVRSHSIRSCVHEILQFSSRLGLVRVNIIGACLVKGSKVVLADGKIVNIETLGKYHDQDIAIEIKTPQHFVDSGNPKIVTANKFFKYENQLTIKITTSNGNIVQGTYNHPLMVDGKWVKLEDIRIGDILETENDKTNKVIDKICIAEPTTVYDIQVPKIHAFITNGSIISHNSGSGKTSLAQTIAHLCHSMSMESSNEKIPYEVKFLQKEDLADFTTTIKSLSSNNQILIFEDLSWMSAEYSKKQIETIMSQITTVRHIDNMTDRKMILIFNTHSQKVMAKFLRITNFTFYSSCSAEEVTYLLEMLGKKYSQKIDLFRRLRIQAMGQGRFSFPLGRNSSYTYQAFAPYLPYLFSNGDFVRFCVAPLRTWIDKDCQTCEKVVESTKENIDSFIADYTKKFTKGIAKRAVELKLLQYGITAQPKRVLQAGKYIDQFINLKKINLMELAEKFGLEDRTTKLFPDKQPEVST